MLLFRFVMQGFDATPTPGICSVVVIHYRDHNGSIVLDFTPGSTVDQILMQFTDAIHEQPCLHTEYLLHHSWLPSNYFAGALLLENPLRVEGLPFLLHVYHALEAPRFYWGSPGKCVLFSYLQYHHVLSVIPDLPAPSI
jgi:hypothetical protein